MGQDRSVETRATDPSRDKRAPSAPFKGISVRLRPVPGECRGCCGGWWRRTMRSRCPDRRLVSVVAAARGRRPGLAACSPPPGRRRRGRRAPLLWAGCAQRAPADQQRLRPLRVGRDRAEGRDLPLRLCPDRRDPGQPAAGLALRARSTGATGGKSRLSGRSVRDGIRGGARLSVTRPPVHGDQPASRPHDLPSHRRNLLLGCAGGGPGQPSVSCRSSLPGCLISAGRHAVLVRSWPRRGRPAYLAAVVGLEPFGAARSGEQRPRGRSGRGPDPGRRDVAADGKPLRSGAAFGAAVATKLIPVIAAPALLFRRPARFMRSRCARSPALTSRMSWRRRGRSSASCPGT